MDFLTQKKQEIKARLDELQPAVEEAARLQAALAALDGATVAFRPSRKPQPATSRKRKSSASGRRGRPRGTGKRQAETLALVAERPGITISEIAAETGVQQSYLYRVLPGLQKEGLVRKEGRGWWVV